MKIETLTSLLAATLFASSAYAQNSTSVSAPVNSDATSAPSMAAAPAPNQFVYTPRLPTAAELSSAAAAQGISVERIEQTATQIVAVYKFSNGQTNTVAYQTLPPATGTAVEPTTPAPTVVYESEPRVVYYDNCDPYYYPWYPPVSVRLGFGFGYHGGHGYRGGYHHWR